jgi:hypothetical protein
MSIASWMTSTIYLASAAGKDAYGKPSYEAPRAVKARVESTRRLVRNARGEEAMSNHRIYTLAMVLLTDRVWLPGASTSSPDASHLPLSVQATPDKTGARILYAVDL